MSPRRVSKKSKTKPRQSNAVGNVSLRHEDRVFELGGKLLRALEKSRLSRNDENVKAIGWFLVCVGESIQKGSLAASRTTRQTYGANAPQSASLSEAFCLAGDQIMNWSAAILQQERKKNE